MGFLDKLACELPAGVERLEITLRREDVDANGVTRVDYGAQFDIIIVYDDGAKRSIAGNLVPHLTAAQVTWLKNLMNSLVQEVNDRIAAVREAQ